jgi:hypothetical protein
MPVKKSDVAVGMRILAEEDEQADYWGTVTSVHPTYVMADYEGDTYKVLFRDIVQVDDAGAAPDAPKPLPPLPPKQDVSKQEAEAAAYGSDPSRARDDRKVNTATKPDGQKTRIEEYRGLDIKQRVARGFIKPGIVVVWSRGPSRRYHKDRLFVVLNYTKNSNQTKVNLAPLNGNAASDGSKKYDQFSGVPITQIEPVFFAQPLHKIGGSN